MYKFYRDLYIVRTKNETKILKLASYISGINGLRAIAAIAVLLSHATGNWGIFELGWIGVDLFFVISGFLITKILFENRGAQNYFSAFYSRRALRILPIYFIVVVPLVVFHLFWNPAPAFVPLSYLFYLQNSLALDYGWLQGLAHTWTLAIEEQFYLFFPLLLYFIKPRYLVVTFVTLILMIVCFRFFTFYEGFYPYYQSVFTIARMDSFLLGGLVSLIGFYRSSISLKQWNLLFNLMIIFCLICLLFELIHFGNAAQGFWEQLTLGFKNFKYKSNIISPLGHTKYTLLAIFFAAILGKVAYRTSARTEKLIQLLETPFLKRIGEMSYGIYLYHYVFVTACRWLFHINDAPDLLRIILIIFILLATYFTALFSYQKIELPLLRKKKNYLF